MVWNLSMGLYMENIGWIFLGKQFGRLKVPRNVAFFAWTVAHGNSLKEDSHCRSVLYVHKRIGRLLTISPTLCYSNLQGTFGI